MKLLAKAADALIRLAGGDPDIVAPLYRALRRDAVGVHELLRSRDARGFRLSPTAMHVLSLALAGLGSVGIVLAFVMGAERHQPLLGPAVLCAVQVLLLTVSLVGQVVPALLLAEDELAVGWWPIGRRDLVLARLGTALVPALQITLALAAAPLVVLAVTGRPPVLAALSLLLAVLAQTIVVAMATAAFTVALVRAVGTRQSRRLAAPLVDGNLAVLPMLLLPALPALIRFFRAHPRVPDWLPPVWFARFGDPLGGPAAWRGMALAVLLGALVLLVAWRLAAPRAAAATVHVSEPARRRRGHWTDTLPWLLRPWLPGREGWVTGRLLAAHLRDDWRFAANALLIVGLLGGLAWYYTGSRAGNVAPDVALLAGGSQALLVMSMSIPIQLSFSSTPRALWIVVLADLDAGRLLAAQRGVARGLALMPLLTVMAVRGVRLGATPAALVVVLAVLALEFELLLLWYQRLQPLLPFSRAFTRDQSSRTVISGLAMFGVLVVVAIVNSLAAHAPPVRYALLALLPALLWLARGTLARRVAGSRLNAADVVG